MLPDIRLAEPERRAAEMKRLFLVLVLAVSLLLGDCGLLQLNAFAEDTTATTATSTSATLDLGTLIGKLPSLKNSVLYSYDDNTVKYAMSFAVAGLFKMSDGENLISFDAMYVPADEIGGMATIKLFNLGKYITFPILDYINIRPGVFVGANNIGSGGNDVTFDYGFVVSIIDIKF